MIKKLDTIRYSSICTILPTLFFFKLSLGVLNNNFFIVSFSYSIILLPKNVENYLQNVKRYFFRNIFYFSIYYANMKMERKTLN